EEWLCGSPESHTRARNLHGERRPRPLHRISYGALRGHAVEDFVEVVVDEPVSLIRKLVQRGVRYFVGLVDAALDDDIAIEVAVPHMHGYRDVPEAETPRPQLQLDVLDGGASCREGDTLHVRSQRGAQLR